MRGLPVMMQRALSCLLRPIWLVRAEQRGVTCKWHAEREQGFLILAGCHYLGVMR